MAPSSMRAWLRPQFGVQGLWFHTHLPEGRAGKGGEGLSLFPLSCCCGGQIYPHLPDPPCRIGNPGGLALGTWALGIPRADGAEPPEREVSKLVARTVSSTAWHLSLGSFPRKQRAVSSPADRAACGDPHLGRLPCRGGPSPAERPARPRGSVPP